MWFALWILWCLRAVSTYFCVRPAKPHARGPVGVGVGVRDGAAVVVGVALAKQEQALEIHDGTGS